MSKPNRNRDDECSGSQYHCNGDDADDEYDEETDGGDDKYCDRRGRFESTSEDEDDEIETDLMALELSPRQVSTVKPPVHENATSVIQRANTCTVYNGSQVVNTYQQISPDVHSQYIDQGYDFVKSRAKELKSMYVETNGGRECIEVLESEDVLIITGNPGEGKTAIGIMTANKLVKEGFKPVVLTTPQDWNCKVAEADEAEKLVLFIDDMFGSIGVDDHKLNEWLAMNELMTQHLLSRKAKVKIICTTRKKIYLAIKQKLKRFKWFRTFRIVDISVETYAMRENEKKILLQKYFEHHRIPTERRCLHAAQLNPPHGFPHCVELYCTEPHCQNRGIAFFSSPISVLAQEIQILCDDRSTQYYALLLIHLSPLQRISVETMSGEQEFDKNLLNRTRLLSKITVKDGMDIVRAIEKLTDVYLREDEDGSVRFKHDSISEVIGVVATRNSPIPAVNYLDLQFLTEKTKYLIYKESDKDEYAILPKKTTLRLAVRLTDALFNGEAFAACKHHAWDSSNFLNVWLDYVKRNESAKTPGNTVLDDLMTTPIETYYIMQRNSGCRPKETQVGLMFLLYLNKKEKARQEIMNLYHKEAMKESERLLKFRREIRCPSGRKLNHSRCLQVQTCGTGVN